jgi:CubicO group peptidase (beta-lactamase class C family)
LAQLLINSVNSRDPAQWAGFADKAISSAGQKMTAREEYTALLRKIYSQSGGVEIKEVLPQRSPVELRMLVHGKRANRWAILFVSLDEQEPGKLIGVGIVPTDRPGVAKWPNKKMVEAELVLEIKKHVKAAADADRFSGVVLVGKRDRIIVHQAYGLAERSFKVPNNLETKFNLGSMNKMFTSIAIAQLSEQGKLSFNDSLAKVLPEYPNQETAKQIAIHHLLTHTSGLGDIFKPELHEHRERYLKPSDYFPLFANEELAFTPGSRWAYSNAGFVVLGAVIEKISGESYFDYVRQHIYRPAGMQNSDSWELTEVVPNLAVGYLRVEGEDPFGMEERRSNVAFLPWKGSPAGGGYSTARDLFAFAQALRSHRLLSERLTEEMTSGKVATGGGAKYGYGFFALKVDGKEVRGHAGGGAHAGINSDLEIFWDGSYVVAVTGNYDAPAAQNLAKEIVKFLATQ